MIVAFKFPFATGTAQLKDTQERFFGLNDIKFGCTRGLQFCLVRQVGSVAWA